MKYRNEYIINYYDTYRCAAECGPTYSSKQANMKRAVLVLAFLALSVPSWARIHPTHRTEPFTELPTVAESEPLAIATARTGSGQWVLTFEDNFDGPTLNTSIWKPRVNESHCSPCEPELYVPENVYIEDGACRCFKRCGL